MISTIIYFLSDERRQISSSICYVIRNIDFGDDFEGELKIYTECRGLFKSLDTVQICLSQVALNLAIKVVKKSEKKQAHQKPKIHGFLQVEISFFDLAMKLMMACELSITVICIEELMIGLYYF